MLFKQAHLEGIRSGAVSVAFRCWKKPSVKKGTLFNTPIGLVEVLRIVPATEESITNADLMKTGFANREQLLKSLRLNGEGQLYRIEVRYHSADPRLSLREQTMLTDDDVLKLKKKLDRLDQYSKQGEWTAKVLFAIQAHPRKKAAELALLTGYEKESLKVNIRKLKNIGLTISHQTGYELSPLGKSFVSKWR